MPIWQQNLNLKSQQKASLHQNLLKRICIKSDIDKEDIYKLETTPVDLSKISNVVKSDVVKKNLYVELFIKVNAI